MRLKRNRCLIKEGTEWDTYYLMEDDAQADEAMVYQACVSEVEREGFDRDLGENLEC